MILFISLYPQQSNEKDGMLQRVAAIDKMFEDRERVYLQISYKRCFIPKVVRVDDRLTVYSINLYLFFCFIIYMGMKSEVVYVQSIFNSVRILPLYLFCRVITDMHGLVPEEISYEGNGLRARWYSFVEAVAVRRSKAIVTVTKAMSDYLRRKYQMPNLQVFNIPIFDLSERNCRLCEPAQIRPRVIYAGGAQKWQNVDMMLEAIKKVESSYEFTILSSDVDVFKEKMTARGMTSVRLLSVRKEEVYSYYGESDLGFLLRDDMPINNVACPTKLIEYMSQSVLPIVIQPSIGDFNTLGYSYILLSDFLSGAMPTEEEMNRMKNNNLKIVEQLNAQVVANIKMLRSF